MGTSSADPASGAVVGAVGTATLAVGATPICRSSVAAQSGEESRRHCC